MGWRDRDYNHSGYGGGPTNPLMSILFGSVSLGTWFGIRVRVHASLIIYAIFNLVFAQARSGLGLRNAIISSVILFAIILLHEFGHCIGARMVHGHADDILLWPLGGLATVSTPRRPWPSFVATACGPLVNLIICAAALLALEVAYGFKMPLPLNPLLPFATGPQVQADPSLMHIFFNPLPGDWTFYVWWIYNVSWMLFVFNVFLPIFPMDGGRMLQEILWPIVGYVRSMKFACITGIVGGGLIAVLGLVTGQLLLTMLGIMGIFYCYQTLLLVRHGYLEEDTGPDYSASLWDEPPRRKKIKKGWFRTARKRAERDAAEQLKIDVILAKVHDKGLHSLTWWEKRTLKKATERQRQRDLAERL